jgi:hypothetical protein
MIGPFSEPVPAIAPHARLLYADHLKATELWSKWPEALQIIDRYIDNHPRLNLANDGLYLYFFSGQDQEKADDQVAWVGREITGHVSRADQGLKTFDSFKSEVFNWELPSDQFGKLDGSGLLRVAGQLRGLAGGALADTWRVILHPMEPWRRDPEINKDLPRVTFQFYKKD